MSEYGDPLEKTMPRLDLAEDSSASEESGIAEIVASQSAASVSEYGREKSVNYMMLEPSDEMTPTPEMSMPMQKLAVAGYSEEELKKCKDYEAELNALQMKFLHERIKRYEVTLELMEVKRMLKEKEHKEEKERIRRNSKQYHQADFSEDSSFEALGIPHAQGSVDVSISKKPLGKYGGYGQVFQLKICESDLTCAAKVFHTHFVHQERNFTEILKREGAFLRECSHEHVVKYHGFCSIPTLSEAPILIMELMETDFERYYTENPTLSIQDTIRILRQVAHGLDYLHSFNPKIVHRDLSARNVLLCGTSSPLPVAKITDFGCSRFIPDSFTTGRVLMVPTDITRYCYLAPEYRDPHYDEKVDIFSFGHLSLASSIKHVISEIQSIRMRGSNKGRSEVERRSKYFDLLQTQIGKDHPFESLIKNCLSLDSKDRPSATELITKLEESLKTPFNPQDSIGSGASSSNSL